MRNELRTQQRCGSRTVFWGTAMRKKTTWLVAIGVAIIAAVVIYQFFIPDIHDLAYRGEIDRLRSVLTRNGSLIHSRNKGGRTPLHIAASYGNQVSADRIKKQKAIMNLLFSFNPDMEARDNSGETPLHLTARYARYWNAVALIENGAEVDSRENNARTPLHLACSNVGTSNDSTAIAKLLIANGADIHATGTLNGQQPLHFVSTPEQVELLLSHGAKINAQDKEGRTPLFWSVWGGREEVVRALLERGALVDIPNKNGATPLHRAAQAGLVEALLACGADVNVRDKQQRTPLHMTGRLERVQLLILNGSDINAKDANGQTPLDHILRVLEVQSGTGSQSRQIGELQRTVEFLKGQGAVRGQPPDGSDAATP